MCYRLAEMRIARGWSQAELARRAGTSQTNIARYESGKCDMKAGMVISLSAALGVTISALLGVEEGAVAEDEARVLELYRSMSDEGKLETVHFMEYAAQRFPREGASVPASAA